MVVVGTCFTYILANSNSWHTPHIFERERQPMRGQLPNSQCRLDFFHPTILMLPLLLLLLLLLVLVLVVVVLMSGFQDSGMMKLSFSR